EHIRVVQTGRILGTPSTSFVTAITSIDCLDRNRGLLRHCNAICGKTVRAPEFPGFRHAHQLRCRLTCITRPERSNTARLERWRKRWRSITACQEGPSSGKGSSQARPKALRVTTRVAFSASRGL